MKKLLSLVLVLTFVFAGTAIAEDKLSISGQYRAEFYSTDNTNDFSDAAEDAEAYVDQRFRIQFAIAPADNVKAFLRGDFAEDQWGDIGYRPNAGHDTIMIDRAYVDLTTAILNWKVGLQGYGGFGKGLTTDYQGTAILATADFAPVAVTALWTKLDEGLSVVDDASNADEDVDAYGIQVAYNADAFGAGVFYAIANDKQGADDDQATVLGLYGEASMGMFSFWAEYDLYGGDDGANTDYFGNVLTAQVAAAVSDQLKITSQFMWAAGSDDMSEMQIQNGLLDDGTVTTLDLGWNDLIGEYWNYQGDGDQFEANSGAMTFNLKADFAINEAFSVYGGFAWSTPSEEDPNGDNVYIDGATVFAIGGSYAFLPGTSFKVGYETTSLSGENISDDSASKVMAGLFVNF